MWCHLVYSYNVIHILVFFALASICGSVITQGIFPHQRKIYTNGVINDRMLGSGVMAQRFELNNMVVTEWGRIFVGAVNRIYELDSDLTVLSEAETGPVNDSLKCLPDPKIPCNSPTSLTDNYNKILIHYKGLKEKLLTCGSVYQGACEARNLKNISRAQSYYESETGSILDFAVAANDARATTIAFVAPGPPDLDSEVLYVGATYTGGKVDVYTEQLRGVVPSISSRSLGRNRFQLNAKFDNIQAMYSAIYIRKDVRSKFLIDYVTGFSSGIYSYFLTRQYASVQSTDKTSPVVSKVIQICQKDLYYNSYIDMPLVCQSENSGKVYSYLQAAKITKASKNLQLSFGLRSADDILIALFSDNEGDHESNSAICVYTMQYIRRQLLENAQKCFNGEDLSGGGYLTKKRCQQLGPFYREEEYLCNKDLESIGNIVGIEVATSNPILEYKGTWLTSIAVTTTWDQTVCIVGTGDGYIKKIVLETHERAREYEQVAVDLGSPINQNIQIYENSIYVMSKQKIARLLLSNCDSRMSCSSCLEDGDPFCGWCVLDNRCTQNSQCADSLSDRWLFGPPGQTCVAITNVSPRTIAVTERPTLYLTIYQLPDGSDYTCVFPELNATSRAEYWAYGVYCLAPDILQSGIRVTGSQDLTIALNSSETGKLFLAQNFTYFNCSSFQSCSQCTNNTWSCDWCLYDNKCVHDSLSVCQPGAVLSLSYRGIESQQHISSSTGMKGPQFCPGIDADKTGKIYIPEGVEKDIVIWGYSFPQPRNLQYTCHVMVGDIEYTSRANRSSDGNITCHLNSMMVPSHYTEGMYEAQLHIYWGNLYRVEDKKGLYVTIYRCDVLARGECGLCHNVNHTLPQLQCYWCDSGCKYQSHCHKLHAEPCPAPQIQIVTPLSGPIGGGTYVNISGKDLGSKFEEIQNAISIAGIRCAPLRDRYQPSQWIVCRLGPSLSERSGVVTVALPDRLAVTFHQKFSYQDPTITRINPTAGPISGGSTITISGENLNTGRDITASIGKVECMIIRDMVTSNMAFCETKPTNQSTEPPQPFRMFFDGYEEKNLNVNFEYLPDPVILNIEPLQSYYSGGRRITVHGTNLHAVQQPQMFATFTDSDNNVRMTEKQVCTAIGPTEMLCPSPRISRVHLGLLNYRIQRHSRQRPTRDVVPMDVQLGFVMDNVMSVRNLSGSGVQSQMTYYPDPIMHNFSEPNSVKKFKGEVLIFEAKGLSLAATKKDVEVYIGTQTCNVTNLSDTQIFCTPPTSQPQGKDERGNKDSSYPVVTVKVGNLEFRVGRLEYEQMAVLAFPSEYIMGIAAGGGFMLLMILLILILCRRMNHKAERNYRKMQLLLDNLESNVRNECKQAFAELQTDITDLTTVLEGGGIPFWDYHTYTFKVLFPGLSDHVILHPPVIEQKTGSVGFTEHGLQHFYHLLGHRHFLLTLIRTLEEQKTFGIRDKVNVASLLMVIYQDNLEYATEILKALLNELVEKSVLGKHPKLMLRRTESVVEKMLTNWLSLCMYKYLRDTAGSSLYVLYRAMKLHVEKGPVDCMTGDARYTLSEDKLLRDKVDAKPLNLNVFYEGEVTQCKVLNCDTITQAKEKIIDQLYKNIPFSNRPWACDLDLEWKKGSIPVTLQDEDSSTMKWEGWKKINTLQHYRVFDGSECALIRRYQTIKSPNGSLDTSVVSVNSSMAILRSESDNGIKFFHLVKHDELQTKEGGVKMVPEVFLPRLLATKGTLQKFMDDFFQTILSVNQSMPPVIKYLFDYLDSAAHTYGIHDPDIVHTWKCNSLPLRFWVNIIKNPDFVFDIHKPVIVDSCLSVVAQTFMDSCSTSEHRLGKDSPSNKLLFAKDIPNYRKMVDRFFREIRDMPAVSDKEMGTYLTGVSRVCHDNYFIQNNEDKSQPCDTTTSILAYPGKVYKSSALKELYTYVHNYSSQLMEVLDADPVGSRQQLAAKLGTVITAMEGPLVGRQAYV
ncbi:plexin-B-like isoform X2 [Dreissena polymorpha]|uniref:plexin-B-like isoform X2 n=1 Tax=Dreissena polymorpha TaxID=45954 RepID=UPI002264A929|nr:plexin-B-like isoform X2 [Dreissena polymorpha]